MKYLIYTWAFTVARRNCM